MKKGKFIKGLLFVLSLVVTIFVAPSFVGAEDVTNSEENVSDKVYIHPDYLYQVVTEADELNTSSGIICNTGYTCAYAGIKSGSIDFNIQREVQKIDINVDVTSPIYEGDTQTGTQTETITLSRYYFVPAPVVNDDINVGAADVDVSKVAIKVYYNDNLGSKSSGASLPSLAGANLWIGTTGTVQIKVACSGSAATGYTAAVCGNIRYIAVTEYQFAKSAVTISSNQVTALGSYTTVGSEAYRKENYAFTTGFNYTISGSSYSARQLYVTIFYLSGSTYSVYADTLTVYYVSGEASFGTPTITEYTAPSDVPDGKFKYSASLTASTSKIAVVYDSSSNRAIRDNNGSAAATQADIAYAATPSCVVYYAASSCTLTKTSDDAYPANATAYFRYSFRKMSNTTPTSFLTYADKTKKIRLLDVDTVTTTSCVNKSSHYYCANGDKITITFKFSDTTFSTLSGGGVTINKLKRHGGSNYASSTFACSITSNVLSCVYTVSNSSNLDVLDNNNLIVDGIYLLATTQLKYTTNEPTPLLIGNDSSFSDITYSVITTNSRCTIDAIARDSGGTFSSAYRLIDKASTTSATYQYSFTWNCPNIYKFDGTTTKLYDAQRMTYNTAGITLTSDSKYYFQSGATIQKGTMTNSSTSSYAKAAINSDSTATTYTDDLKYTVTVGSTVSGYPYGYIKVVHSFATSVYADFAGNEIVYKSGLTTSLTTHIEYTTATSAPDISISATLIYKAAADGCDTFGTGSNAGVKFTISDAYYNTDGVANVNGGDIGFPAVATEIQNNRISGIPSANLKDSVKTCSVVSGGKIECTYGYTDASKEVTLVAMDYYGATRTFKITISPITRAKLTDSVIVDLEDHSSDESNHRLFHQTQRTLNVFLRDTNTYPSATLAFDYSIYDLGVITTGACKVSSVSSLSGYDKIGDLVKHSTPTSGVEAKLNSEFAVTTAGNHGYYLYSPSRGIGLQIYIEIQTVNGAGTYDETKRTLSFFKTTHSVFSNGGADNNAGNNHYIDTTAPTISSISASTSGCHDYSSTAGYYCNAGDKITFTVNFSEPVYGSALTLALNGGSLTIATQTTALKASSTYDIDTLGSLTKVATYVYTVPTGSHCFLLSTVKVTKGSGQNVYDRSARALSLASSYNLSSTESIYVDTVNPTISSFTLTGTKYANNGYDPNAGYTATIAVTAKYEAADACSYCWIAKYEIYDSTTQIKTVGYVEKNSAMPEITVSVNLKDGVNGKHTLTLYVYDAAENVISETEDIILDTVSPTLDRKSPYDGTTDATESAKSGDNRNTTAFTYSKSYTMGDAYISNYANFHFDPQDNIDGGSLRVENVTVSKTSGACTIAAPNANYDNSGKFYGPCYYTYNSTKYFGVKSVHTFTLLAVDKAGNSLSAVYTITINQRSIGVVFKNASHMYDASSRTFNGAGQYTITNLAPGDSTTNVSYKITGTLTGTNASFSASTCGTTATIIDAGVYTLSPCAITVNSSSRSWPTSGATWTGTGLPGTSIVAADSNFYTISPTNGTYTINQRTVTITYNGTIDNGATSLTYDNREHLFSDLSNYYVTDTGSTKCFSGDVNSDTDSGSERI